MAGNTQQMMQPQMQPQQPQQAGMVPQITSLQPQIATLQTQPIIAGTSVAPSAVTFGTQQPIAVVQAPHQPHQVVVSGPAASMAAGPPIQILPAGPQALAVPP